MIDTVAPVNVLAVADDRRVDLGPDAASELSRLLSDVFDYPVSEEWLRRIHATAQHVGSTMIGRLASEVTDYLLNYVLHYIAAREFADDASVCHMEIGTLFGGSLILAARAVAESGVDRVVVAIDPLDGYYTGNSAVASQADVITKLPVNLATLRHNLAVNGIDARAIEIIAGHSTAAEVRQRTGTRRISCLFIDGDHTATGIDNDWRYFASRVVDGGYVLIDNYNDSVWPEVSHFVNSRVLRGEDAEAWTPKLVLGRSILLQRSPRTNSAFAYSLASVGERRDLVEARLQKENRYFRKVLKTATEAAKKLERNAGADALRQRSQPGPKGHNTMRTPDERFVGFILTSFKDALLRGSKSICFYGVGLETELALSRLAKEGVLARADVTLVDGDAGKKGRVVQGCVIHGPECVGTSHVDVLIVGSNRHKEVILREFSARSAELPHVCLYGTSHIYLDDPDYLAVKTSGGACIREHLFQSVKYVLRNGIPGDFIELGVGAGNTTCYLGALMKHFGVTDRRIYALDTFAGFPPRRHLLDLDMDNIEEHYQRSCTLDAVRARCAEFGSLITFVKGDVTDVLPALRDVRFAFSFHDMDNYTPTKDSLSFIYERTSSHGILAFDHFNVQGHGLTMGQRVAVREFLAGHDSDLQLSGTNILLKCA